MVGARRWPPLTTSPEREAGPAAVLSWRNSRRKDRHRLSPPARKLLQYLSTPELQAGWMNLLRGMRGSEGEQGTGPQAGTAGPDPSQLHASPAALWALGRGLGALGRGLGADGSGQLKGRRKGPDPRQAVWPQQNSGSHGSFPLHP